MADERKRTSRLLSLLISTYLPWKPALGVVAEEMGGKTGAALIAIRDKLDQGEGVADAFKPHPDLFPEAVFKQLQDADGETDVRMNLEKVFTYQESLGEARAVQGPYVELVHNLGESGSAGELETSAPMLAKMLAHADGVAQKGYPELREDLVRAWGDALDKGIPLQPADTMSSSGGVRCFVFHWTYFIRGKIFCQYS